MTDDLHEPAETQQVRLGDHLTSRRQLFKLGGAAAIATAGAATAGASPAAAATWTDANTKWPNQFDPCHIDATKYKFLATHPNTTGNPPVVVGTFLLGHHLLVQDTGVSDNFEVGCNWLIDQSQRQLGQVGPACFVDLGPTINTEQMGLAVVYDISIYNGAIYIQNVFREKPISDVDNTTYYTTILNGVGNQAQKLKTFKNSTDPQNVMAIRVQNGMMQQYLNGVALGTPTAVPPWAVGRTWMGIHVISQKQPIGATDMFDHTTIITQIIPEIASSWYMNPL